MERIKATLENVIYHNPENGYSVYQVNEEGTIGYQTVVGTFSDVAEGSLLVLDGVWRTDKRYGRQFAVEAWHEELPSSVLGIERYLSSGLIKGIGPTMAHRIVKKFGKDTFWVLENNPDMLLQVQGIGRDRMKKIKDSWLKQKDVKEIMIFLQGCGVSAAYAVKIYKEYGNESIGKVKENPYCLADDVFGIGFKMADAIAFKLGYSQNDMRRCKAGVVYTLNQLSNSGHCYADRDQLIKYACDLLQVDERLVDEAISVLLFDEALIDDDDAIFLPMFYHSEIGVANKIKTLLRNKTDNLLDGSFDIRRISEQTGIDYDDVQVDAIKQALTSKVMVLTGNPGTGKTTTLLGIIAAFESFKLQILCAAPTGRAAKRMSEATGREAMTIHRLLEYSHDGFVRNKDNPLTGDVLIIDESSMIDISLMNALIKAIPKKMRLILVGDIDQLPSVGAGNVLRDIIDSRVVPVIRLTRIFRQALSSRIVTNAHRVNHGEMPDITNGKDADFFFLNEDDPERAAGKIVDLVSNRLPHAYGYSIDDIQVLVPMKNSPVGVTNLNIVLQEALNPEGECLIVGSYKFRPGDKVMQIRNNYDKNVFNGDIGTVKAIDIEERTMTVMFDKEVDYESGEFSELVLSYACTIHKSQGLEYPVVIMPLLMSHYIMLQRNLVYTGITRAKKLCIIIGSKKALAMAVKNESVSKRNTRLKERLNEE